MRHLPKSAVATAILSLGLLATPGAQAISLSLDDNPAAPIAGNPAGVIPGFGAENPFGPATPGPLRVIPPGLAPSPSLVLIPPGFGDGEILGPGPVLNVSAPGLAPGVPSSPWLDALSNNTGIRGDIRLDFSVDRASHPAFGGGGLPGTAVAAQAALDQQPGDIFRTTRQFTAPGTFAGGLAGAGFVGALPTATAVPGGNVLVLDESAMGLTATGVVGALTPPTVPGAPIGRGTHDNVDAFDWTVFDVNGDLTTDEWLYFSVNPDESAITGFSAADIFAVPPGAGGGFLFAPAPALGLLPGPVVDDIDALVMWDLGTVGTLDAGLDYALFSLSPGSASLTAFALNAADVFFTDFSGAFALYADALDMGLVPGPLGFTGDNIDALEVMIPEPSILALLGLGLVGLGFARTRKRTA